MQVCLNGSRMVTGQTPPDTNPKGTYPLDTYPLGHIPSLYIQNILSILQNMQISISFYQLEITHIRGAIQATKTM